MMEFTESCSRVVSPQFPQQRSREISQKPGKTWWGSLDETNGWTRANIFEVLLSDERMRQHIIRDSDVIRLPHLLHRICVDPISRIGPCWSEMIVRFGLIEIARIEAEPVGRS
jgi:hypothetical protein